VLIPADMRLLQELVEANLELYVDEYQSQFTALTGRKISQTKLIEAFLELDLPRKKLTMRAKESKLEDQIDFIVAARQFQPHQVIFVDEVHTKSKNRGKKIWTCP
jgi:hypothetical protein